MIEEYLFKPVRGYWFTKYLVEQLRECRDCCEATLDIGLSKTIICMRNGYVIVGDVEIQLRDVEPSSRDRVTVYVDGRIYEVERRAMTGYYKLKAVALDKAPTLEINGIHMHRIEGTRPWNDSKLKVAKARVKRGDTVLDTCTGLGYTATHSLLRGARTVYTVEIDRNVLWIAENNPWSRRLADSRARVFLGDVVEAVKHFNDQFFDKIIHDPPRYSGETGDLYSLEFYRELYRVLRRGGILYHYTGEPRRGVGIVKGVGERLRRAGFYPVFFDEKTKGYIAFKSL